MNCVLIIGACDIGTNIAKNFINKNINVVVGYHNNIKEKIDATYIRCDVTKEEDIKNIIEYCMNKYGKIDSLINLANINMDNSFLNKTKNEFMNVLEVNLVGTFLLNQYYCRYNDNGMIINFASTDGIDTGSIYSIDYSASKAGIITMSSIISKNTTNKIYCLCPNWIDSDSTNSMNKDYLESELKRINQGRLIKIEEIIEVINDILNNKYEQSNTIRIDILEDKLCIETMNI